MAGLKDIKRRIRSVGNTKKITYAMKLVSAAKLRKAQDSVQSARAYTDSLNKLVGQVFDATEGEELSHPLMEAREEVKRVRVVVIGGSRGLCGAFNSNLNKRLNQALLDLEEKYPTAEIDTYVLGKKPREHIERSEIPCVKKIEDLSEDALDWPIEEVARDLQEAFLGEEIDEVYLLFTKFKSAMTQTPTMELLLPLSSESFRDETTPATEQGASLMIFEPSPEAVFQSIIPRILRTRIQQGGLDAKASEHGSRMVAMDSATKNAGELAQQLKLTHNKLRQGAITAELLDIIGGAEAV